MKKAIQIQTQNKYVVLHTTLNKRIVLSSDSEDEEGIRQEEWEKDGKEKNNNKCTKIFSNS